MGVRVERHRGPGMKMLENLLGLDTSKVGKVGWLESAKYPDGQSVAYVATIQEYGSAPQGIPPRPMMRPTINEQEQSWRKIAQQGARAILSGKATNQTVLEAIALKSSGDIRKKIASITSPALSFSTIAARKSKLASKGATGVSTKPLVDTGVLLATLTGVVEPK